MNYEEAKKELNTIYLATEIQRVPVVKEEVQEALKIANECIEKQSNIVHCKNCENWKIITIETIDGRTAEAGQCELTKWLCGEQGYCMYGREVQDEID